MRHLPSAGLFALSLLAWLVASRPTIASDVCHHMGHDPFHGGVIGADAHDDALNVALELPSGGAPTAQFVKQGGKWPQPGGLGSPVTITYSYNNVLDGGLKDIHGQSLSVALIRDSIEEALGLWASVAPLHFVEVPDQGTSPPPVSGYPNGQFGQIRFHHIFMNGPDIPGQDPIAKAQAYFPATGNNLGGDIYFDHGDPWQEAGELSRPDVLGATIHELGHALGLGHTNVAEANMYWVFTRTSALGTGALHADDIAGIRAVYGTGVGSVTALALVPEPSTAFLLAMALVAIPMTIASRRRAA